MRDKNYWNELPEIQKKLKEKIKKDYWRLDWHLMPETGWLNDPNGLVHFDDVYHIYHQYTPEAPSGEGKRHWGHKTSKDLVNFKEEEIFLSPETSFDLDGVFSGSAIEKDDKLHFFYTGNVEQEGDHDYNFSGREQNTIHAISTDGYTIDEQHVIIPYTDYPAGYSDHIRDPKVFQKGDHYYLVLGARSRENKGAILLYKSTDFEKWEYHSVLIKGRFDEGYMWECPDLFELEDNDILLFSPQGLLPTNYYYHNPYSVVYQLGKIDWEIGTLEKIGKFKQLDHGFDFYAPQTFIDKKGRRILFGWMGIGDTEPEYSNPTIARGWQHALTMPRELKLVEEKLVQIPLKEYQSLRQNHKKMLLNSQDVKKLYGEIYELSIIFDELPDNFHMRLREDTELIFKANEFILKHGESGYGRRARKIELEQLYNIRIFSDTSSLEVFINDGEDVFTTRLYPKKESNQIKIDGDLNGKVEFWELKK